MERAVGFIAAAGPLQGDARRDDLDDIQPALYVIDDGHSPPSSLLSLTPVGRPSDLFKCSVFPPPNNRFAPALSRRRAPMCAWHTITQYYSIMIGALVFGQVNRGRETNS